MACLPHLLAPWELRKYAQRTFHLVMAAEPDYEDTELQYYVKVLNGCKGHAKAFESSREAVFLTKQVLCGSPWGPFHTPGECELCKLRHLVKIFRTPRPRY